jgi:hypothetical protein
MKQFLILSVIVGILHPVTAHWTYGQQKGFNNFFREAANLIYIFIL